MIKTRNNDLFANGSLLNNKKSEVPPLCSLIRKRLLNESRLPDVAFDLLYEQRHRTISDFFWTPVAVAREAMAWLPPGDNLKILDIGSGIGKFCLVSALISKHRLYGVELRSHLVREARRVADHFPEATISLKCGNAFKLDWNEFNVLYFFNPFAELNFQVPRQNDFSEKIENCFSSSIAETQKRLSRLSRDTLVITYYTFGAPMPAGFERQKVQRFDSGYLELWKKL